MNYDKYVFVNLVTNCNANSSYNHTFENILIKTSPLVAGGAVNVKKDKIIDRT
jgi:hypothetical protein